MKLFQTLLFVLIFINISLIQKSLQCIKSTLSDNSNCNDGDVNCDDNKKVLYYYG